MTIRHLRVFREVFERRSMTEAAQALFFSQPAVSAAIKELEEHYNVKLFDRIGKRLFPTEAGNRYYEYASHLVRLFDEMEESAATFGTDSPLRIGSSITIGTHYLPAIIKLFSNRPGACPVRVIIAPSEAIEKKIAESEIDLALSEGSVSSDSVICNRFASDSLVTVGAPNVYPTEFSELIKLPFLLREKGSGSRQAVDAVLSAAGYSLTPLWESTSTQALVKAVENGLGISVLPKAMVREAIEEGRLMEIPCRELSVSRTYNIFRHRNKYLTPSALLFIQTVESFGKTLSY